MKKITFRNKMRIVSAPNPKGYWGRKTLKAMNNDHSRLTDWGISMFDMPDNPVCLDVGCGGGLTVQKLASHTENTVYGVDISDEAIYLTQKLNKKDVKHGKVVLIKSDVKELNIPDNSIDIATAVETFYFWQDKVACLTKIYNLLKTGGQLVIMLDAYDDGDTDYMQHIVDLIGLELNTIDQFYSMLSTAGFTEITHATNGKKICIKASK